MKVDGGCHCGHISYEAEIDPNSVFLCHCTDCQTLSGTAFRTVVPTPESKFNLLTGIPKTYIKTGESGAKRPREFNLRVGTIRQREELRPTAQYWFRSAQEWVMDLAGMKQIAKE
jgi:hypothetical protein